MVKRVPRRSDAGHDRDNKVDAVIVEVEERAIDEGPKGGSD